MKYQLLKIFCFIFYVASTKDKLSQMSGTFSTLGFIKLMYLLGCVLHAEQAGVKVTLWSRRCGSSDCLPVESQSFVVTVKSLACVWQLGGLLPVRLAFKQIMLTAEGVVSVGLHVKKRKSTLTFF